MFDFDIGKLMVVAIVALAVIPPKDLPRVMRTVGQVVGKMRRMAAEFQGQFMDAMREADLENVRKELEALNEKAKIDTTFDPAGMIRDEVTKAAAPLDIGASQIGASQVALTPPQPAPPAAEMPARVEADLEGVRKEIEALNEKAVIGEEAAKAAAPREDGTSGVAHKVAEPVPAPGEAPAGFEASAKQSAAE